MLSRGSIYLVNILILTTIGKTRQLIPGQDGYIDNNIIEYKKAIEVKMTCNLVEIFIKTFVITASICLLVCMLVCLVYRYRVRRKISWLEYQFAREYAEVSGNTSFDTKKIHTLLDKEWIVISKHQGCTLKSQPFRLEPTEKGNSHSLFGIYCRSKDSYGDWMAQGYLGQNGQETRILLLVDYEDKVRLSRGLSGQILKYEGTLEGLEFHGSWDFQGIQHNEADYGSFTMVLRCSDGQHDQSAPSSLSVNPP